MKIFIALFLAMLSSVSLAGNLLADGVVYRVDTSTSTADTFAVFIKSTASVPCPEGYGIVFFVSNAPNSKAFDRAYAALLTAVLTGQQVIVYGTKDNVCSSAAYVTVNG